MYLPSFCIKAINGLIQKRRNSIATALVLLY